MLIQRRAMMIGVASSAALSALALMPGISQAQSYPNKPIKLIVPFAAGGATDLYARLLGAALSVELREQVVIEARPGVGGLTGVDVCRKVREATPSRWVRSATNHRPARLLL